MTDDIRHEHDRDHRRVAYASVQVPLGDGDCAVEAVADDGSTTLWYARPLTPSMEAEVVHGDARGATHEATGPLPPMWAHRVQVARLRCGRPRSGSGLPCRTPTFHAGQPCGNHRPRAGGNL